MIHRRKEVKDARIPYINWIFLDAVQDGTELVLNGSSGSVVGKVCLRTLRTRGEAVSCECPYCFVGLRDAFCPDAAIVVSGVDDALENHLAYAVREELRKFGTGYRAVGDTEEDEF